MSLAYKQAEVSVKGVADSLRTLGSEEKLESLIKQQSINGSKGLTQAQTEQVIATQGVNAATRQSVAEKINAIATTRQTIQSLQEEIATQRSYTIALSAKAEAERQASISKKEAQLASEKAKLENLEKNLGGSIPQKSGMSVGMMWAVAATTTVVSAFNTFSQSKQAKNIGEAVGSSIGGGITSALSGAMVGFQVGGAWGAVAGAAIGLVTTIGSSIIGFNAGDAQRAIDTAKEIAEEYKQATESIKSNLSTIEGLQDEFIKLSHGVDDYGQNVSLGTEEYKRYTEILQTILGISPQLISGYSDEGDALANKNGLIEESIRLLKEEAKERLAAVTTDEARETTAKAAVKTYKNAQEDNDYAMVERFIESFIYDLDNGKRLGIELNVDIKDDEAMEKWQDFRNFVFNDDFTINFDNIFGDYERFKSEGLDFGFITQDDINTLDMHYTNYVEAKAKMNKALKSAGDEYKSQLVNDARSADAYDTLSAKQKDFITQYINNLDTAGKKQSELTQMSKDMVDFVNNLGANESGKSIVENLLDPKHAQESAAKYRQTIIDDVDGLSDDIKNAIVKKTDGMSKEDWAVQIAAKLGFDVIDKLPDIKAEIRKALELNTSDNDKDIVYNLAATLNMEQLQSAQRTLAELVSNPNVSVEERQSYAQALNDYFTEGQQALNDSVEAAKKAYADGEISSVEANKRIKQSFEDTYPEAAGLVAFLLDVFKVIPPTVDGSTSAVVNSIKTAQEEYDKLQSTMNKIKSGEGLSNIEIMELVDSGQIMLSDVKVDENGFMKVPIEVFERAMEEIKTKFNNKIEEQLGEVAKLQSENKNKFDEADGYKGATPEQIKTYEEEKARLDGIADSLERFKNVKFELNTDFIQILNSELDDIQSAYNTASKAIEEYSEKGYYSVDTYQALLNVAPEYIGMLIDEEGNLTLTKEVLYAVAAARIDDLAAKQKTKLLELVSTYGNEETALAALKKTIDDTTKSQIDLNAELLKGVQNEDLSLELMNRFNSIDKWADGAKAGIGKDGLSSGSGGKSSSSDPLKDAFTQEYNTLKHNLDMEYITEKQYYDSLIALNQKYFAGKEEYLDDYRKYEEEVYKGLQKYYTNYIESQMNLLEKQLDAGTINYQHYSSTVKSLIKNMYNDGKISAEDYHKYMQQMLEKQLAIYDKVLSAIKRRFDKEIDYYDKLIDGIEEQNNALEKQLDLMDSAINAVVSYYDELIDKQNEMAHELEKQNDAISKQISKYDSLLNVVERVYSAEQDKLKEQQDAIQEKIDALNDESSAYDLLYRKEQALYELQRSQSQRTQKVYVAGKGVVYNTDQNAIREASKNLADIKTEELVNQLEKEKEALQESIDALDEWKDKWAEISDAYNKLADERIAIELLGPEYESRILSNSLEDIEYFKEKYISSNQQIDDNAAMIDSYNEKTEYYERLKKQWSGLTESLQKEADNQIAAELFGADWEKRINEDRFNEYASFRDRYLNIQNQINDNTALIDSYNEKITYYNGLKDQWADIADAYNQSMEDQYAAMILGQNWESDILSGRIDTLNNFKNDYSDIQQKIVDIAWQSANEQIKAAQEAAKATSGSQGSASSVGSSTSTRSGTTTATTKKGYVVIDSISGGVIREGFSTSEAAQAWVTAKKLVYPNAMVSLKKYARGGIVGSSTTPLDFLARSLGEDHMIAANEGERVLTPRQNAIWEAWTEKLPQIINMENLITPSLSQPNLINRSLQATEITQHISVTLPNVTNTGGYDNLKKFFSEAALASYQYKTQR